MAICVVWLYLVKFKTIGSSLIFTAVLGFSRYIREPRRQDKGSPYLRQCYSRRYSVEGNVLFHFVCLVLFILIYFGINLPFSILCCCCCLCLCYYHNHERIWYTKIYLEMKSSHWKYIHFFHFIYLLFGDGIKYWLLFNVTKSN